MVATLTFFKIHLLCFSRHFFKLKSKGHPVAARLDAGFSPAEVLGQEKCSWASPEEAKCNSSVKAVFAALWASQQWQSGLLHSKVHLRNEVQKLHQVWVPPLRYITCPEPKLLALISRQNAPAKGKLPKRKTCLRRMCNLSLFLPSELNTEQIHLLSNLTFHRVTKMHSSEAFAAESVSMSAPTEGEGFFRDKNWMTLILLLRNDLMT